MHTNTYHITGYFQSINFRITHAKLNFEGFIFIHFHLLASYTVMYVKLHGANKCAHLEVTSAVTWLGMVS